LDVEKVKLCHFDVVLGRSHRKSRAPHTFHGGAGNVHKNMDNFHVI
jgi:hypothetical protein